MFFAKVIAVRSRNCFSEVVSYKGTFINSNLLRIENLFMNSVWTCKSWLFDGAWTYSIIDTWLSVRAIIIMIIIISFTCVWRFLNKRSSSIYKRRKNIHSVRFYPTITFKLIHLLKWSRSNKIKNRLKELNRFSPACSKCLKHHRHPTWFGNWKVTRLWCSCSGWLWCRCCGKL